MGPPAGCYVCTWWAARLGCERAAVGGPPLALTAWAGFKKTHSHLAGGWFLARKAAWALSGCMTTGSADCCTRPAQWVTLHTI